MWHMLTTMEQGRWPGARQQAIRPKYLSERLANSNPKHITRQFNSCKRRSPVLAMF